MQAAPLPAPSEAAKRAFWRAYGGTVFLDEIGEASLKLQVQLLRLLREKEAGIKGTTQK